MAVIKCRTKNAKNSKGKARVYFTCHPEDFRWYFDKVCEDIFKTQDCAIYYTEDMTAIMSEEDKRIDIGHNNLFVIPVTTKLLTTPNRAMDEDLAYALKEHMPILPIVMETGIDNLYSATDRFGELQYLNPYSQDTTEICYEEKLKRYLESVLISNELANRVRAAFDTYIFLSYRKKDRNYANQLMRQIHSNPQCRDIAIWYDEFLTPGESFKENISKVIRNSKLFALLVTPNLLEEPGGKPNFVMEMEYPAAVEAGIGILPAEMVKTDKETLAEKFNGLPPCVDPDDEAFIERLLETVSRVATTCTIEDPLHNYLIGLAYLDGIDVEVDRIRGLELITLAAEAGLHEAMAKLYQMHNDGDGVPQNYREATRWAERALQDIQEKHGEEHSFALKFLGFVADNYWSVNKKKALGLYEKEYMLRCKTQGEEHPDTIRALHWLANSYKELCKYDKAIELYEKEYMLRCKTQGEKHTDTISTLLWLAFAFSESGNHIKAQELYEKEYIMRCSTQGEEHPNTILALHRLASAFSEAGNYIKALELYEKEYILSCSVQGEGHPETIEVLTTLASLHNALGNHQKAQDVYKTVYAISCKALGENHPETGSILFRLANHFEHEGDDLAALEMREKRYEFHCRTLGEEHADTISDLVNLAFTHSKLGNYLKAWVLCEEAYVPACKTMEAGHYFGVLNLLLLARTYRAIKDYNKALEICEKAYKHQRDLHKEGDSDTIASLDGMACVYWDLRNYKKALETYEEKYKLCCMCWGREHHKTIEARWDMALTYRELGEYENALKITKEVYGLRCNTLGEQHPDSLTVHNYMKQYYRLMKVCQHCGGKFKSMFQRKCSNCGKSKDY